MRHIYVAVLVLTIAALTLFVPSSQSYPEPTNIVCIVGPTPEACFINPTGALDEDECIALHGIYRSTEDGDYYTVPIPHNLDSGPQWYSPAEPFVSQEDRDMWDEICTPGCCRILFEGDMFDDEEDVSDWYCENRDWGDNVQSTQWYGPDDGGVCPDPQITTCLVGQQGPGCVCGNRNLEAGEYCCEGNVISGQACATAEPEVPDGDGLIQVPETCGNNQLDFPGEECDGTHVDACTASEGASPTCTPACRCSGPSDYDQYDGYCHPYAECAREVICAETEGPVVVARSITATDQAIIMWDDSNFVEACENAFVGFEVIIQGSGSESLGADARNYTFQVQSEQTYTITVEAIYDDGVSASDSITFTAGHEMCFTEQRAFCQEATQQGQPSTQRWVCDIRNARTAEPCTGGYCYPTLDQETRVAGAVCSPAVDCDLCSGAYANFGETRGDTVISVEQGEDTLNLRCDQLDSVPSEFGDIAYCHLDFTTTALKEYASCSIATGCFQYRSQSACEANTCGVPPGECEWNEEFGFCSTDSIAHQTCGSDSEEACLAEGASCQWVTTEGGARCERNRGYCEDYRTQEACTGGTNFVLRTNDYGEVSRSQDALGIGKCVWQEARNRCIKDADNDGNQDPLVPLRLRTDLTNPVTSLRGSPGTQTFGSDVAIPYFVSKPVRYTYTRLNTGACGAIQSPPTSAANVDAEARIISYRNVANGEHCLQYYSQDAARNTEQVRQVTITVDSRALEIDIDWTLRPTAVNADGERYTTVDVITETNRQATCQFSMTGPNGVVNEDTRYFTHTRFARIYADLPDGQYTFEATCWMQGHEPITETRVITLDSDTRMTNPIPPVGTYTDSIIRTEYEGVGIHTQDPSAVCRVTHGPNTYTLEPQGQVGIDGQPYTPHITNEISFNTGVHVLTPTCEFEDFTLTAGAADLIIFAIDEQAPTTRLRYEEDGQNYTFTGGDVIVGLEGRTVNIECLEPEITGRNRNWESGCQATFFRIEGEAFVDREPSFSFRLEPEQTITVYSVDALGNVGPQRSFTGVDVDVSGPRAERFWIERDSEGTQ